MKPINEKERTLAFIQFMVLAVLAVILIMFVVFFNYDLKSRQNDVLKSQNKTLVEEKRFLSGLSHEIDSLVRVIKSMDGMESDQLVVTRTKISDQLRDLTKNISDSSDVSKLKKSLSDALYNWATDKIIVKNAKDNERIINDCKKEVIELNKSIEDWRQKYNEANRVKL